LKDFANIKKNNSRFSLRQVAEDHGISQNRSQIIPGRFYQLMTMVPTPSINAEFVRQHTGKNYLDLNPVGLLLFHENWKEVNLVLNLKVIPAVVCNKLLEAYWRFSMLNGLANLFDKEHKLIPLEMRRLIDQRFYLITPTALSTILGVDNLNYAINKYDMDYVLDAKLIDWDKFGMLVNPQFSTDGLYPDPINIMAVFEDFLTKSIGT
jgi:hypothetical protein